MHSSGDQECEEALLNVRHYAGMLVLYDDRYQPGARGGGKEPPTYSAEENYGQYIYVYRNGVRNRLSILCHAHGTGRATAGPPASLSSHLQTVALMLACAYAGHQVWLPSGHHSQPGSQHQ